jgi:hypothetical protein
METPQLNTVISEQSSGNQSIDARQFEDFKQRISLIISPRSSPKTQPTPLPTPVNSPNNLHDIHHMYENKARAENKEYLENKEYSDDSHSENSGPPTIVENKVNNLVPPVNVFDHEPPSEEILFRRQIKLVIIINCVYISVLFFLVLVYENMLDIVKLLLLLNVLVTLVNIIILKIYNIRSLGLTFYKFYCLLNTFNPMSSLLYAMIIKEFSTQNALWFFASVVQFVFNARYL